VIFKTMSLLTMKDVSSFLRAVDLRHPNFFADHVKTLSLIDEYSEDVHFRILSVCTSVTNLTCSGISCQGFEALSGLHSLRRISSTFHQSPFYLPSLQNVTHLVVMDRSPVWTQPGFICQDSLPQLTHLVLRLSLPTYWGNEGKDAVPDLLRGQLSRSSMRVCVLLAEHGEHVLETKEFLGHIDDSRLVILSVKRLTCGISEYGLSIDRIDDVWKVAEQVALLQRNSVGDGSVGVIPDERIFDVDWIGYYQSLADEFDTSLETASDAGVSEDEELF